MTDCRDKLTAEVGRLRANGWIVESSQRDEYLLRKRGRSVFPFRLLSFRGVLWCLVTFGLAFMVWLTVAMFYSWWAWSLPAHRERVKTLRIERDGPIETVVIT